MNFYSYIYRDPRNSEPIYVGKGSGDRAHVHRIKPARNPHLRSRIDAIRADGFEPSVEVIQALNEDHAFFLEECLIELFGRRDIGTGTLTNHTAGGEGMTKPSPIVRARISAAVKATLTPEKLAYIRAAQRAAMTDEVRSKLSAIQKKLCESPERRERLRLQSLGKKASDETRAKMSAARKCKPKPDGFGEKISAALKGRKMPEGSRLAQAASWTPERREKVAEMNRSRAGKKASDETRAKMSAAHKGKPKSPEHLAAIAAARARKKAERLESGTL